MSNVLSPRDLVSKPDNMDETVLHTSKTDVEVGPVKSIAVIYD